MFGFPKIENKSFKRNFLKTVIFQIKFDNNELVNSKKEEIKKLFQKEFPRQSDTLTSGIQINIKSNQTQFLNPVQEKNGMELKSEYGQKVITINDSTFSYTVSGKVYKNYKTLKNDLEDLNTFVEICEITNFNRLAIRKINIIDFALDNNPVGILNWMFNENLTGNLNHFPSTEKISHNIQSLNYIDNDNFLNIKYGINVPNVTTQIGQVIIDIDLYQTKEIDTNELFECADIINKEVFNVFNWILSDKTVDLLNNIE